MLRSSVFICLPEMPCWWVYKKCETVLHDWERTIYIQQFHDTPSLPPFLPSALFAVTSSRVEGKAQQSLTESGWPGHLDQPQRIFRCWYPHPLITRKLFPHFGKHSFIYPYFTFFNQNSNNSIINHRLRSV